MKIVYNGNSGFCSAASCRSCEKNGYEVTAVVTQPDKPKGRGKTLLPNPGKGGSAETRDYRYISRKKSEIRNLWKF